MRRRNIFERFYYWLIADDVNNDLGAMYLMAAARIILAIMIVGCIIITMIKLL